jgi:hypothetical protein
MVAPGPADAQKQAMELLVQDASQYHDLAHREQAVRAGPMWSCTSTSRHSHPDCQHPRHIAQLSEPIFRSKRSAVLPVMRTSSRWCSTARECPSTSAAHNDSHQPHNGEPSKQHMTRVRSTDARLRSTPVRSITSTIGNMAVTQTSRTWFPCVVGITTPHTKAAGHSPCNPAHANSTPDHRTGLPPADGPRSWCTASDARLPNPVTVV